MNHVCFIPIDTHEDEIIALRCLFSAHGLHIIDIEPDDVTRGFIGFPDEDAVTPDIEELTNSTLKGILKNREGTIFVIASMENEQFHVVEKLDSKCVSKIFKAEEFRTYFNACMKNCRDSKLHTDLAILNKIWQNTVNK
jgi:hypothetical protein